MKHEVRNKTIFSGTLTTLTLILLCMACEKEGQEAEIPAYLYLQPFELRSQEAGQGSASEKITEAWLSVDGAFLGAYSLPALVPVLGEGTREISLQAGIRDNGIGRTPEVYPFYETFRTTRDLQTNSIDTIRPVIGYLDRARFSLIDDFERGPTVFREIRIGTTDNALRPTETMVFEGNASGVIRLSAQSPVVELASEVRYSDLNAESPFVYLEVNYKSEVPVVWGIIAYQFGAPGNGTPLFEPGFRPSPEWNKIYFNLSPLIAAGNFSEYQLALQAAIPQENGQPTTQEAFIWLDNIKLVHF